MAHGLEFFFFISSPDDGCDLQPCSPESFHFPGEGLLYLAFLSYFAKNNLFSQTELHQRFEPDAYSTIQVLYLNNR